MSFISRFFIGILLGAGAILPGISSGVLCVIFGIYHKLVDSVLGIIKDFRKNFFFLLPFVIGGVIGVVFLGNILLYLFESYPIYLKFSFIGLILGSIPAFYQDLQKKQNSKSSYTYLTLFAFFLAIFLVYLEKFNLLSTSELFTPSFLHLFFSGILMSIGIVIPGVSSTILLMLVGVYPTYLSAVSSFNLSILIPMSLGVILGGFLFLKLLKYLMKNYSASTFSFIFGFTLGSIFVIFPGFAFDITHLLALRTFLRFYFFNLHFNKKRSTLKVLFFIFDISQ